MKNLVNYSSSTHYDTEQPLKINEVPILSDHQENLIHKIKIIVLVSMIT